MEFRLLGPIEARDGDRILVSGTGKAVALLALLLLRANEVISTDRLIDDLWTERAPRTAAKSLQTYVSQLRRALGEDAIVTRPRGYLLPVGRDALDSARFEELVEAGRAELERGDAAAAAAALREALALWHGAALGEVAHEPWARPDAERLEEARLQALEARLEADLALGRHRDVVAELEGLTREHPLREHCLALLMLALYRCGRQADALATYRAGRQGLHDNLGIEPIPELKALEQQILRHDPALARPPAHRAASAPRSRRGRGPLVAAALVAAATAALWLAFGRGSTASPSLAAANTAVLVDPRGRLGVEIPVGASPAHAASGDGFLWTSNERDDTVSRIDPDRRIVETIPVGRSPEGLALADGDVWVANGGDGSVAAIDPRAGKTVRIVRVGNGPLGLAARGHELWVASSVDGTLSTVDTRSFRVVGTVPVGPGPTAVAATANAVWVALAGSGAVAELDRDGQHIIQIVRVGNDPAALAVAGDRVWVANAEDDTVSRVDPASGSVDATISVSGSPTSLAAGDGVVWATLANGRLAQIDSHSARVVRTSVVGGTPAAVVPDGSSAWVVTLAAPATHRGGTLRMETASFSGCGCLDPLAVWSASGWQFVDLVYDGLVAYRRVGGPAGGALVGDLALAVPEPSADGRTYVFRLRRGVRFSTGRVVRPSDVRASLERAFRVNHVNVFPLYTHIVGAAACRPGSRCDLSYGIVADDRAGTVTFHLTSPDPNFLYTLALPWAFVVPADTPMKIALRPLPGTGPYRIASLAPSRRFVLVRNRRFRVFAPAATPDGFPDRIIATTNVPTSRQVTAVEHGTADLATFLVDLRPSLVTLLATHYASQLHADSLGSTEYVFLNTRVPPFERLDARRAVNEAVDRAKLVQLDGGPDAARATCQILPPDFPGYRPYCPYGLRPSAAGTWTGPNLGRARRLVAASGTRGVRVKVWAPADHAAVATYFAGLLRRLGYRATTHIVAGHTSRYYEEVGNPDSSAQLGWSGWIRDYTSAADFIRPLFACSGIIAGDPADTSNYSLLCDPTLDHQIDAAGRIQQHDPVAGQVAWAAADRAIVNRAAAVPYANNLSLTLLSQRTDNYQYNPEWGVLLDQLWVR